MLVLLFGRRQSRQCKLEELEKTEKKTCRKTRIIPNCESSLLLPHLLDGITSAPRIDFAVLLLESAEMLISYHFIVVVFKSAFKKMNV